MKKLNSIVVDPYLNDDMCIDRLVENWKLHNGIIIEFDFDNTIFDHLISLLLAIKSITTLCWIIELV